MQKDVYVYDESYNEVGVVAVKELLDGFNFGTYPETYFVWHQLDDDYVGLGDFVERNKSSMTNVVKGRNRFAVNSKDAPSTPSLVKQDANFTYPHYHVVDFSMHGGLIGLFLRYSKTLESFLNKKHKEGWDFVRMDSDNPNIITLLLSLILLIITVFIYTKFPAKVLIFKRR